MNSRRGCGRIPGHCHRKNGTITADRSRFCAIPRQWQVFGMSSGCIRGWMRKTAADFDYCLALSRLQKLAFLSNWSNIAPRSQSKLGPGECQAPAETGTILFVKRAFGRRDVLYGETNLGRNEARIDFLRDTEAMLKRVQSYNRLILFFPWMEDARPPRLVEPVPFAFICSGQWTCISRLERCSENAESAKQGICMDLKHSTANSLMHVGYSEESCARSCECKRTSPLKETPCPGDFPRIACL